ncbi:unnamed protein product [Closterium sp. NIES-54]
MSYLRDVHIKHSQTMGQPHRPVQGERRRAKLGAEEVIESAEATRSGATGAPADGATQRIRVNMVLAWPVGGGPSCQTCYRGHRFTGQQVPTTAGRPIAGAGATVLAAMESPSHPSFFHLLLQYP